MKSTTLIPGAATAVLLLVGMTAWAGTFDYSSGTLNAAIPDGNPIGITSTLNESAANMPAFISDVTVTLQISGGNNGDLYGYLSYDGVIVSLFNRPGVSGSNPLGATGSGFNVTLSDGIFGNINNNGGTDGALVTGTFNAAAGSAAFGNAYDNLNANGSWTLFLADLSGGNGSGDLVSWTLNVTAVPEPVNVALIVFGVLAAGCVAVRRWLASLRNSAKV